VRDGSRYFDSSSATLQIRIGVRKKEEQEQTKRLKKLVIVAVVQRLREVREQWSLG
jgi:hypothetical protein